MKYLLLCLLFLVQIAHAQITATSWLIAREQGEILAGGNIDEVRSIASITKLMVVLTVLDKNLDLNQAIMIRRLPKISTHIHSRIKHLTREELISLALVSSDNLAAYLLCANYDGLGFDMSMPCINAMNAKAKALGMNNTVFTEPSGLYASNVSTARDLIKLVQIASKYQVIQENSDRRNITINITPKKQKSLNNTNPLIGKNHNILVSKTGWIKSSGGCLIMLVRADPANRIVIVLGSKTTKTRVMEAEIISELPDREDQDWIYKYLRIER